MKSILSVCRSHAPSDAPKQTLFLICCNYLPSPEAPGAHKVRNYTVWLNQFSLLPPIIFKRASRSFSHRFRRPTFQMKSAANLCDSKLMPPDMVVTCLCDIGHGIGFYWTCRDIKRLQHKSQRMLTCAGHVRALCLWHVTCACESHATLTGPH